MSYSANIIIEEKDQPVFRKSGTARVVGEKIIFEAEGKAIEIPIHGCEIQLGGTGNKQAYLTNSLKKNVTLQVNDFGLFRQPAFNEIPAAQQFRKDRNKHNSLFWSGALIVSILILVPFYMIFIERDYLIGKIVERVPPEYDVKLGDIVAPLSVQNEITDPSIREDFNSLVQPLLAAAAREPYEYHFYIVNDDIVNAFAVPGGHIIINSGLIEATQRPEELLGVIAHEMAHVNERHSMKSIMRSLSTQVFFVLLGADPNLVVSTLANQADFLSGRSYSRDAESEADAEGFKYLVAAGIDPSGLHGFFDILKEEESALTSNRLFAITSTHPLTDDRIDDLHDLMDNSSLNTRAFKPISVNYEDFKDKVLRATQETNSDSAPPLTTE